MSQYYTSSGDQGFTGLLGDLRVPKYHPQPEALGALDEASAVLGMARSLAHHPWTRAWLKQAQGHLYQLMAEVAATPENAAAFRQITEDHIHWVEARIQQVEDIVAPPREFILPGDDTGAALLSLARTVVRRAERRVVFLAHLGLFRNPHGLTYLNRLSSLCYALELLELHARGVPLTKAQDVADPPSE